jgi:hypothetical protein
VNTLNTVDPLGDPSLDHAVEPPDANRSWLPLDTCGNLSTSPQSQNTARTYSSEGGQRNAASARQFTTTNSAVACWTGWSVLQIQHTNKECIPFEEVMVKLFVVPDKCMVASVWVDHVPRVRIPPPEDASMNAVAGSVPGVYTIRISTELTM